MAVVTGPAPVRRGRTGVSVLCWVAVAPFAVWALVRAGGVERGPLVPLIAFTPYVAGLSVVPVLLAVALRRRWAAAVALLAAVVLAACVLPRAVTHPGADAGATGPELRVLTANLLFGQADAAAVVAAVRADRVDVLAVQEFTPESERALDAAGIAAQLPHRYVDPRPAASGSGLYSRYPLTAGAARLNPNGFGQVSAVVSVPGGPPVRVDSVHPCPPVDPTDLSCWRRGLAAQPRAGGPHGPLRILAGDFNATLDHAPLRALRDSGYRDAAAVRGTGLVGTWGPYDGDPFPPVAIDHVLADRRIGVAGVSTRRFPGADHRALLVELILPRA